ncbi:MAG: flagellar basal-body rod protein FlgF [Thermodesulfobacteriota bacterium]
MDNGIYVSTSGAVGHMRKLDEITNNLANVNVPGYKKDVQVFEEYLTKETAEGTATEITKDTAFVHVSKVVTDFSQGITAKTDNPTDLAIMGDGFFVIDTPEGPRYTRKGDFIIDDKGQLITKDGNPVKASYGVIKLTSTDITIVDSGRITGYGTVLGKLDIVVFEKPYNLTKAGAGLFIADEGATPKPATGAKVMQGYLERANTNAVKEMVSMITALRSYESQMKLIQSFDKITEQAISLGGR